MRIVLAKEKNLFEVNELIKKINLNVEEYHWVISDVTLSMLHDRNNQSHSDAGLYGFFISEGRTFQKIFT
ncbi:hypothetical protein P9C93_13300 [Bacillus safensis]|uniref:hypothetical protein n=1 Tax=Bacillus safensis TaxID=561879 RepID=UPI002DBBF502|nr:hypothetical protein [Bacillus safensis]MEC1411571.1 hypothetical protein [Bacillus safensis]